MRPRPSACLSLVVEPSQHLVVRTAWLQDRGLDPGRIVACDLSYAPAGAARMLSLRKGSVSAEEEGYMEDLIMAALSGNESGVLALLAAGADANRPGDNGWTVLGSAAARGHERIVERALTAGARVDHPDVRGMTALMRAAAGGHVAIAKRLLLAKASTDRTDIRGRTALMRAADNRRAEMVELLLTAGANVNATDRRGRTALMTAALGGDTKIVELLLKAGANVHKADATSSSEFACSAVEEASAVGAASRRSAVGSAEL